MFSFIIISGRQSDILKSNKTRKEENAQFKELLNRWHRVLFISSCCCGYLSFALESQWLESIPLATWLCLVSDAGCKSRGLTCHRRDLSPPFPSFFNGSACSTYTHTQLTTLIRLALLGHCPVVLTSHSLFPFPLSTLFKFTIMSDSFWGHNERTLLGLLWLSHFNVYANMRATQRQREIPQTRWHLSIPCGDSWRWCGIAGLKDMSECWPNRAQHSGAAI